MKNLIRKFQFIVFSLLTIIISITSWIIAKEFTGTFNMLFNQLGYFGPALSAIIISVALSKNRKEIKAKSYLPFIIVWVIVILFSIIYGKEYYEIGIEKLLLNNPLITGITAIVVLYFIIQYVLNKGKSVIDQLALMPKTNFIWYAIAVALYPLLKYFGVKVSAILFSMQIETPQVNLILILPILMYGILFTASIGEEIGWRGYALRKLQQKHSPFVASLFIGIVWSIWHIGYITIVQGYPVQQLLGAVIFTFILSFFSTWLFNKTNGSILVLILFHFSQSYSKIYIPHPIILFALNIILLTIVLLTGRFFKKPETENIDI